MKPWMLLVGGLLIYVALGNQDRLHRGLWPEHYYERLVERGRALLDEDAQRLAAMQREIDRLRADGLDSGEAYQALVEDIIWLRRDIADEADRLVRHERRLDEARLR